MKYIAFTKDNKYKLEIVRDTSVGYYLYVYDIAKGDCIQDFLQDTLNFAMEDAKENYGISKKDWSSSN